MKLLITFLFASFSFANTVNSVFLTNSDLSNELKEEVIVAVEKSFPCVNSYGLKEVETTVRKDRVDQGIIDLYFTTTFKANITYDYHPRTITVLVESVLWAGSNPSVDWTEVTNVSSPNFNECE